MPEQATELRTFAGMIAFHRQERGRECALAVPTLLSSDQATVSFTQTPIPEPALSPLLLAGGLLLLIRRRM